MKQKYYVANNIGISYLREYSCLAMQMYMVLQDSYLNVVKEKGLRDLLDKGYSLEVICHEDVQYEGGQYKGLWTIQAISSDNSITKQLIVTNSAVVRVREFKYPTALITLFKNLDFTQINLTFVAGTSGRSYRN